MPLSSGNNADNGSYEYTAVGHEQGDDDNDNLMQKERYGNHVEIGRSSPGISDGDEHSKNTKDVSSRIHESSEITSKPTPNTDDVPTIAGWPTKPQHLKSFSILTLTGDMLLNLLPIAFLVIAISAWRLDGKELSDSGKSVERTMHLGPTIFPLAFAAVGSRSLRSIAIFLAERGTTLATLEKLLGSQSLASAVGTAYTLRSASVMSLSLLALWLLSPLGGQSSLRLFHETNSIESEPGTVYYADHEAPLALSSLPNWFTIVPAILSASLASSAKAKGRPVDLWNHPKIPRLGALEQEALVHPNSTGDWIHVNQNSNKTYSSFTGINVQGLRSDGTSEFQVKSNYLRLECSKYTSGTNEEVHDFLKNSTTLSIYPSFETLDYSDPPKTSSEDYFDITSFFIRSAWDTKPDDNLGDTANMSDRIEFFNGQPISYLYGANFNTGSVERMSQIYKCTPRLVTVGAQVECHSEACAVTRLRPAMRGKDEQLGSHCTVSNRQNQACLTTATWALETFFSQLTIALGSDFVSTNTNPFDDWIAGSIETYRTTTHDYARNLSSISDEMISDRLTIILNTYFQAGSWGPQITRAGLLDTPVYPYVGPDFAPERWLSTTNATFSRQVPVYKADVGWIVTLLSITVVLLLLSVLNVVVSFATIAPDLFYYASSLARENPYVNTPDRGTGLSGAERSRLLKGMKVQVADVSPDSQVGYVVLKSVDTGEGFQVGRLRKDRMYW